MDKPVIIIEAPELDDRGVANVRAFLYEILLAFDSHYYHRLREYHCLSSLLHEPINQRGKEQEDKKEEINF